MMNVPAGKSISVADVKKAMKSRKPTATQKASISSGTSTTNKRPRKNPSIEDDIAEASNNSESSDDDRDVNKKWSEEDLSGSGIAESFDDLPETDFSTASVISQAGPSNVPSDHSKGSEANTFKVDDFVVVNFEEKLFPGRVTEVKPEEYIVRTMDRSKMYWKWPTREDAILYSKEEVLNTIEPSRPRPFLDNVNKPSTV
ncbi:hypothetical protein FQA39_LY02139 [Lamprigera yunnana]|nr:hypothetical protein FQA39_LY02139 [Lamprigera yunnana]